MITPSPTTKIEPHLARGVLEDVVPAVGTRPGHIVLGVLNTSYQIHLQATTDVHVEKGKRLVGTIRARARRIDVVQSGGRYVEPVFGRPRRVQGVVVGIDPGTNSVVVNAGVPIVCAMTDTRQKATDFAAGQFVSFDVLDGATFTPEG